mmetsp:Transcript_37283/g.90535  ORF Transcript_37283/g.90535 Transcript_37283/m.90535 type:complete len:114 (+) Transcript_37283:96-437(+)|eukprot:CAMPEP_0113623628 /NCGR_PEP_ID=MMETSP0017_2-20120614/12159_1 /TAXON_ID=2856 /ORGANISM="Cylindrotheca closterium" /LENGTH=113 /DNA_ID=CAMNT_0000533591 /DNA_START=50 /DNA_END=391 /DNA_ORIENTATION=+ /assembly_acc=CAM_ASM_000147
MSVNPIFPANRQELKAFASVLDISCVESRAAYEQAKAGRFSPAVADIAGNSFRPCAIDTYSSITSGECADLFADVMKCNSKNEYNYGRMCKDVRRALETCAAKNKYGEFGKKY